MVKVKLDINKKVIETAVKGIQGISHPVRLTILYALSKQEMSVGDLSSYCGVSQSVTSQHLSKMKENGLLDNRKESNKVYYSIKDSKYKELIKIILKLYPDPTIKKEQK